MIARFKTMSGETVSHIGPALHFDKGGAEDAIYESMSPPSSHPNLDAHFPVNARMTILQKSQEAQARMPGFAYWLLVLLVAASTFWICGGHVLFSPRHAAGPHVPGTSVPAPGEQRDPLAGR